MFWVGGGGVLRYHLVCSLIYPQGAGHLLACNGCSGQIWKTGSVFALHEWKHRNVPLANRGQCLDATERLPGPATASRDSTRLKLLAQRGAAASLGLAQLFTGAVPGWATAASPTVPCQTRRSPWSHWVILQLLSVTFSPSVRFLSALSAALITMISFYDLVEVQMGSD